MEQQSRKHARPAWRLPVACLVFLVTVVSALPVEAQGNPAGQASALCDSALVCLDRGDTNRARALLQAALELAPDDPRIQLGMGRVLSGIPGRRDQALEHLARAAELDPDNPEVYWQAALANRALGTHEARDDHIHQSLRQLERVVELDPGRREAWELQADLQGDRLGDIEAVLDVRERQVTACPADTAARHDFLELALDMGEWERAVQATADLLADTTDDCTSLLHLAVAYWKLHRFDEAMARFEHYFTLAPEAEVALYFNLGHVLTPNQAGEYLPLDDTGRANYWRNYWRSRDPDFSTPVNERLLEHFIRVAYARREFSRGKWPWDARGNFYVRYGEPDLRMGSNNPQPVGLIDDLAYFYTRRALQDSLGIARDRNEYSPGWLEGKYPVLGMDSRVDGSGTAETWIYIARGIDIRFDNPVMNGNYLVDDLPGFAELKEAMGRRMPVISLEEERIKSFRPLESAVTFRGRNDRTVLEYALGLRPDHFDPWRRIGEENNTFDLTVDLFTETWRTVIDSTEQHRFLDDLPQTEIYGNPIFIHGLRTEADPGEYTLSVLVRNPGSGHQAAVNERLVLPDYSGSELMVSDILPALQITMRRADSRLRFIRGDLEVLPLPGRVLGRDQPLFVYFEIYNLVKDRVGATRYRVEYTVAESDADDTFLRKIYQGLRGLIGRRPQRAILSSDMTVDSIWETVRTWLEIDMSALPFGAYDLSITITDLNTGLSDGSSLTFRTVRDLPLDQ